MNSDNQPECSICGAPIVIQEIRTPGTVERCESCGYAPMIVMGVGCMSLHPESCPMKSVLEKKE